MSGRRPAGWGHAGQTAAGLWAIAEFLVSDLLREGRISLVRGEWIGPGHEREAVPDQQAALRAWATWVPRPDEPVVWMADPDTPTSR